MVMTETLPLAEVKAKLSEMVGRVEHTHDRITVTRNGRPASVLISPEELDSLEDRIDLLADADAMAELRQARAAVEAGDYVTGDELRATYRVPVTQSRPTRYELRVAGPAARQLDRLPDKVAAAIVEFILGPLLDGPHHVGGPLRRELEGLHSARRGACRVVCEIHDQARRSSCCASSTARPSIDPADRRRAPCPNTTAAASKEVTPW